MLEESIKRNVIIAMDTGSGKTHIAVLRIKHEVEREPSKVCASGDMQWSQSLINLLPSRLLGSLRLRLRCVRNRRPLYKPTCRFPLALSPVLWSQTSGSRQHCGGVF